MCCCFAATLPIMDFPKAEELVADIRATVRIPMVAVLGNHDFESGQEDLVSKVLDEAVSTCSMVKRSKSRDRVCRYCRLRRRFRPANAERMGRTAY
jgi:hypothetical protein